MKKLLAIVALVLGFGQASAADLVLSTGAQFLPGFRQVDGSDLNVMVNAINAINDGSNPGIFTTLRSTGTTSLAGATAASSALIATATASSVNAVGVVGGVTTVGPRITPTGGSSDTNIGIILAGKGTGSACLGGTTCANASLSAVTTASAVNQVVITGRATGTPPLIAAGGSGADANTGLIVYGNGGGVYLGGNTTATAALKAINVASSVNQVVVTSAATGNSPSIALTGDANRDISVAGAGTGIVALGQARATCSGTTTATCQGQRFTVSVTGLTTAASTAAAAMTVTNASVASSSALVICQVNGYGGTGQPIPTAVTPGTGSVAITVLNVSTGAALNATVPIACAVF